MGVDGHARPAVEVDRIQSPQVASVGAPERAVMWMRPNVKSTVYGFRV